MSETITVIYEQGVLRPTLPLSLPEHAQVQIQIVTPTPDTDKDAERRRVRQVLLKAGIIQAHPPAQAVSLVSDAQLTAAAEALAAAGPLSELIIAEREAR